MSCSAWPSLTLSVWPLYNAVVVARWMLEIPDRLMGRVQSAAALLGWAPVPLAPLVGGLLIESVGETWTVLIFAAIMLTVAIIATLNRTIRVESTRSTSIDATARELAKHA